MKMEKRKLLLQSCCGPCSTVCIERLCEIYDVAYELILDTLMLDDYDSKLSNKVSSFKTFLYTLETCCGL